MGTLLGATSSVGAMRPVETTSSETWAPAGVRSAVSPGTHATPADGLLCNAILEK